MENCGAICIKMTQFKSFHINVCTLQSGKKVYCTVNHQRAAALNPDDSRSVQSLSLPKTLRHAPAASLPASSRRPCLPPTLGNSSVLKIMALYPLYLLTPRPPPLLVDAGPCRPVVGLPPSRRRRLLGRLHGFSFRCDSSSSSASAPRDRPPRPRQQRQRGRGDALDPVGFLTKHGISDRAFTQFLRDRYVLGVCSQHRNGRLRVQFPFLQFPLYQICLNRTTIDD